MHGHALPRWVLQVGDRERCALGEAFVIYPMSMDTALQGLAINDLVSRIAKDAVARNRQRTTPLASARGAH